MATTMKARTGSPSIDRRRIKERDASRRDFEVRLVAGETLADSLKPEFLGSKADLLMPGDRVTILGHEMAEWQELLIVESDEALSSVKAIVLLGPINLQPRIEASQPFDTSKAQIEQLDGDVWRIRLGNKVVASGFRTEREAQKRLDEIRSGRKA